MEVRVQAGKVCPTLGVGGGQVHYDLLRDVICCILALKCFIHTQRVSFCASS